MMKIDINTHIFKDIKYINIDNFDNRSKNIDIDTIIIHCISLPAGKYDNDNVINLFKNNLDIKKHKSFNDLANLKVSSHLFIRRNGELIQFVPFHLRAWHAGVSNFRGRDNCNDFSIGIELEGTTDSKFTDEQYSMLINVITSIKAYYPKIIDDNIIGHDEIAPNRKSDPGVYFDWERLKGNI